LLRIEVYHDDIREVVCASGVRLVSVREDGQSIIVRDLESWSAKGERLLIERLHAEYNEQAQQAHHLRSHGLNHHFLVKEKCPTVLGRSSRHDREEAMTKGSGDGKLYRICCIGENDEDEAQDEDRVHLKLTY
jgi:hypothetical protein